MKKLAYLILLLTIGFNLWLNYPESKILADPNDNIFQFSLVNRTNWVWDNYGCPLSLSCIPNLVDHMVPNWAEGYPLPFYYSHIPQIATVFSFRMIASPLLSVLGYHVSLFEYYTFTRYLLLAFFPLSVFIALRIVGISPIPAALGALFSAHLSTDGLYGIDPPSFLWRGYGLTSQLYALIFLPLGIAFTYKALAGGPSEGSQKALHLASEKKGHGAERLNFAMQLKRNFGIREEQDPQFYIILAFLFLTLTTAGHLGIGIIGLLSTLPFLFFDIKFQNIWYRVKKLALISICVILALSYWIVPVLLKNNYHIISFWDPIWKFNSYGWYEVMRQFFAGEIFDWQRLPIITGLVIIGFFALAVRKKYFTFSLLFAFWMLLYFGSTTWGGLLNIIPGMKDFHQSRFIVGVQVAALFLIPAGLEWLFSFISNIKDQISNILYAGDAREGLPARAAALKNEAMKGEHGMGEPSGRTRKFESYINITFYILIFIFASILIYFTVQQTISYAQLNNKWIYQANDAYRYDEKNFKNLLSKIDSIPGGRIYAGRPGNWGKDFRLGSTQLYLLFGGIGYDISQFLPETWSPLSENEQNFDERETLDYDLLNIKSVVAPKNEGFASSVKLADKFGPFELYQASSSGWFDVVTSPMFVKSDKTNFLNIVHLWWNSYARRWKMFPLISVEKDPAIPQDIQRVIEMKDEVTYKDLNFTAGDAREGSQTEMYRSLGIPERQDPQIKMKNIFTDFPFVFPQATPSGQIILEKVDKQTYSATVNVPKNCKYCYAMLKISYHPDWTVKVDGQDAATVAVFPFYLATPVTAGHHTVEFTYQPNRLKVILLIGEIILGVAIIIFRKKIISKFKT